MNTPPSRPASSGDSGNATTLSRITRIMVVQTAGIGIGAVIGALSGTAMNDLPTGVTWGVTAGAVIGSPLFRRW